MREGRPEGGMMALSERHPGGVALLALCAGAALLCGCAGPRVNLWPIYFQETRRSAEDPGRLVRRIEVAGPLFAMETSPGRLSYAVRPLYNYRRDAERGTCRVQYLWPLGLVSSKRGEHFLHRFFPLFQYDRRVRRGKSEQVVHGMVFPLVFWGHQPGAGGYFAVFPFGGILKGIVGDVFSFVLFPLYSRFESGDYVRHNVLWPIVSWGSTRDGRGRCLRIFPFYVHKSLEGAYDHRYVMWPIVRWGSQQWETRRGRMRRRYLAVNPFYARETTWDEEGNVVAWRRDFLLYKTRRDLRPRHETRSWSALLSLVRREHTPKKDELSIFPFYRSVTHYAPGGRESGRRWIRRRIAYILLWLDDDTLEPQRHKKGVVVAPLYWQHTTLYTGGRYAGRALRRISLWPLITWQSDPDGSRHLWLPSNAWVDRSEGYKRNVRALLDLYQRHVLASGETETRLLGRLYHSRKTAAGRYVSVGPFWTYDGIGDAGAGGRKSWSLFFGLLRREWDEAGSRWRLFYISF